jgi:hypothetical protein
MGMPEAYIIIILKYNLVPPSLRSSGRNVRLWDNPFQGGEESDWPLIWNAQFSLSQDSWLPATDYPRASRSFPRIAGSGNEIDSSIVFVDSSFMAVDSNLKQFADGEQSESSPNASTFQGSIQLCAKMIFFYMDIRNT